MVVEDCAQIVGVSESVEEDRKVFKTNLNTLVCMKEELRGMEKNGNYLAARAGPVSSEKVNVFCSKT